MLGPEREPLMPKSAAEGGILIGATGKSLP
jgi:hypothetical protein